MRAVLDNPRGLLKHRRIIILFSVIRADFRLHTWVCQCNPEELNCHPSAAWRKLAPLCRYQSAVRALRPFFAPSRTVWCRLMRATARQLDERRGGSYTAVPSLRSATESWSSSQAMADGPPIISSNQEQNDNAGRIQCSMTLWHRTATRQVFQKSCTSVSQSVLLLKISM